MAEHRNVTVLGSVHRLQNRSSDAQFEWYNLHIKPTEHLLGRKAATVWDQFYFTWYLFHLQSLTGLRSKVKLRIIHLRTGHEGPEGESRYSSTFSLTSALDGAGNQCHAPAALPPGMTRYPLYRELGDLQHPSGGVRKISTPSGIRCPDRPAGSELLSRPNLFL
jgi:hypothetical protein